MAIRQNSIKGGNGFPVTYEIDSASDFSSLPNNVYYKQVDLDYLVRYKDAIGASVDAFSSATPRVQVVTSAATVTATSSDDLVDITAQAVGLTLANPTGTFTNGQVLEYRIKDNGSAQTIAFGTSFNAFGSALPTTTAGKKMLLMVQYDSNTSKFNVLPKIEEQ